MKRFLWLSLVIMLLALAACGGSQTEPVVEEPAAEAPAAEEPVEEEAAAEEETAAEEEAAPEEETAAEAEEASPQYQIPSIEEGKYNVASVHVGPHDDGGWTQSHDVGRQYIQDNVDNAHTVYVENVAGRIC